MGKTGIESTSKSSTTSQKRIGKDGRTLPARDGDERQKKRQADAKHPAQQSLVPESMDVDEKTELVGADNGLLAPRLESSKIPDVLSSPGSTTQTATTPAIHDVSTDTSPDNEDSQYNEDENAGVEPEKPDGNQALPEAQDIDMKDAGDLPDPTSLQEANAQLLKESVAAASATSNERHLVPDYSPSDNQSISVQEGHIREPDTATAQLEPHGELDSSTSKKTAHLQPPTPGSTSGQQQAQPSSSQTSDRAITRVASGAIKQKSVSEILGVPKPAHESSGLSTAEETRASQALVRRSGMNLGDKLRDKPYNKAPKVLFGKQANKSEENAVVPSRDQGGSLPSDDYFTTLFVDGFTRQSKWMKSIEVILGQAHKTVSTDDCAISLLENQACKVLRRVYHLQQNDKWSLRQPKRCPEPTRPSSHWDVLLQEMKWMRTDFREERKWKRAVARNLADACAEWVASDPEQRKALQVKALIPSPIKGDTSQDPAPDSAKDAEIDFLPTPVPDLVHTGDAESPMDVDEEINDWPVDTIAPSAIFALQDDEVIFGLRKSTMSDQLLDELPMYGAPLKAPKFDLTGSDSDPDAHWRRPALPLSKYVEGQMVISSSGPPCKRSRYRYEEEEESSGDRVLFDNEPADLSKAGPENKDVALFNPDMKPIRDRLHAGHQFRPPTEFNMPLQSFYESRMASQWTWAEDDELKALVREYSYNWSLISSMISTKSCFASGAERRTPWECFERWVQLEGLPNDMSKTQYFQTYQKRIDAAQRVIMQQSQAAQQQVGPNGAVTPVPRRRPTTTVRVERRRNQKHLALIDAMRKLAKKRETTIQKQQHAASLAAMRKANEVQQQRGPNKTPRDYSLMRWERDQQLAEKMAQYAQRQQEVHRRAMAARAQGGQVAQVPQPAGAAQTPQIPNHVGPGTPLAGVPRVNNGQLQVPNQARPRMPMQAPPNAMAGMQAQMAAGGLVPPMPMNGVQQAQMAAGLQAGHRMPMPNPQPDLNLMLQARRISEQQRQAVQMQQQQQHQGQPQQQQAPQSQPMQQSNSGAQQGSPNGVRAGMNGINQQNFLANTQAMMASFNSPNGTAMATSPGAGLSMPSVAAGSPRTHVVQPSRGLPASLVAQLGEIENQIRSKNPNLTQEQSRQIAMDNLQRYLMQRNAQTAMNAAAGASAQQAAMANGIAPSTSPHQYAQLLRAQQQAQAAAAAAAQGNNPHQRQSSGSATPVMGK